MGPADAILPEPEEPSQDEPTEAIEPELPEATAEAPEAIEALAAPVEAAAPEVPETVATPAAHAGEPESMEPMVAETAPAAPAVALDTAVDATEPTPVEPEPELADALAHEIFAEPAAPDPAPRHQTVLAQVELMPVTEAGPVAELPGPADESLGASLIASGIVPKPAAPKIDPLAPIRRMTQAEKIAFFS
jgi:hypothetical protein